MMKNGIREGVRDGMVVRGRKVMGEKDTIIQKLYLGNLYLLNKR